MTPTTAAGVRVCPALICSCSTYEHNVQFIECLAHSSCTLLTMHRMMADGVRKLQGHLASGALAALNSGPPAGPLESGSLLPLPGSAGTGIALPGSLQFDVQLPRGG